MPRFRQSGAGQRFGTVSRRLRTTSLLAMNAICRCQAGQKSDHGVKTAGNLANLG
jgi:hypothetical protein